MLQLRLWRKFCFGKCHFSTRDRLLFGPRMQYVLLQRWLNKFILSGCTGDRAEGTRGRVYCRLIDIYIDAGECVFTVCGLMSSFLGAYISRWVGA